MVFSSLIFLTVFLPVLLLVHAMCPRRYRNYVVLLGSLLFYAWGAPRFVLVLLVSSGCDYFLSCWLVRVPSARARRRRGIISAAVALNLAVFLYFKYSNFVVAEVNGALARFGVSEFAWTEIALPIGISFFTFQKLSYLIDVHRGRVAPAPSLVTYFLYVMLFPQLIAGPIVRYHDVAEQLVGRRCSADKVFAGVCRFCAGLGKKVLIANVLGELADRTFSTDVAELQVFEAWVGAIAYSFQIYFDFSGYSDMAIGLGRMLGFEFLENFNCPYIARSFVDFWRRWHISLSNWMKEYLYIPLGGNRGSVARTAVNLWIVFVLSGLWHGASWNFLVWGMYHGFFMSLGKVSRGLRWPRLPPWLAIPTTFLLVTLGWVLFRANDLGHALAYLQRMSGIGAGAATVPSSMLWHKALVGPRSAATLCAAAVISFVPVFGGGGRARWQSGPGWTMPVRACLSYGASVVVLVWSIAALTAGKFNPFIYFKF